MDTMTEAYDWQGRDLVGADGEKIGSVKAIYEDRASGKPEWALVSSGLFGTRSHFVPLAGARAEGEGVRVDATKDQVKEAPSIEDDGELSEADERRLFEHYNVPYTDEGSTTAQGTPGSGYGDTAASPTAGEGDAATGGTASGYGETRTAESGAGYGAGGEEAGEASGPTTDEAMTRSEEELRVGTAQRERGRVRLRKYVVTEQVQTTIPVQREEVRVEREPITDANVDQALQGPDISEEEHEVVLHEEEPVVEKRVVPKERVRLDKETVTEEREISEEVRKEQIEGPEGDTRL